MNKEAVIEAIKKRLSTTVNKTFINKNEFHLGTGFDLSITAHKTELNKIIDELIKDGYITKRNENFFDITDKGKLLFNV